MTLTKYYSMFVAGEIIPGKHKDSTLLLWIAKLESFTILNFLFHKISRLGCRKTENIEKYQDPSRNYGSMCLSFVMGILGNLPRNLNVRVGKM